MKPALVERVERPAPPVKLPSLLSVDPSIVACGWAVFKGGVRADDLVSWRYGCIRTKAHHSLQERIEAICEALEEVLDGTGVSLMS
jgi:Holliday junction resolvasome RuvABC endonuclease subunit